MFKEKKKNEQEKEEYHDRGKGLPPRFNFSTRHRSTVQQAWLRTPLVLRLSGILHELAQLGTSGAGVILDRAILMAVNDRR